VETVLTLPLPYRWCQSIVLDVGHYKMYMYLIDQDNGYRGRAIARANMDGSGFEILYQIYGNTLIEAAGGFSMYFP
jgi:hypothetical protein